MVARRFHTAEYRTWTLSVCEGQTSEWLGGMLNDASSASASASVPVPVSVSASSSFSLLRSFLDIWFRSRGAFECRGDASEGCLLPGKKGSTEEGLRACGIAELRVWNNGEMEELRN